MDLIKEIDKLMEKHPVLTSAALTLFIWYGSYHLGVGIGEFIANITN